MFDKPFSTLAATYGSVFLVLAIVDGLWIGVIARDFYQRGIGHLMAEQVQWLPAALFYLLYPLAILALALHPWPQTLAAAALRAALLGLTAYGVYDLTNWALLKQWPASVSLVDAAWGTFATALAGSAGWWVAQRLAGTA
jgi:uncharacterized membrane protein